MNNYTTHTEVCQGASAEIFQADAQRKLAKLQIKKAYNKSVIEWLIKQRTEKEMSVAHNIYQCATYIELSNEQGQAKITGANFCRQRICNVCAWRRQAKFLAQITPILEETSKEGCEFLFATLTVKNASYNKLDETISLMMKAYNKFLGRKKIQQSFIGVIRSMEITYNPTEDSYHPHIHMLIAIKPDYFYDKRKYISQAELTDIWKSCLSVNYTPVCHIEKVSNSQRAEVETIKYALKPSSYEQALNAFYYILRGRRLISFSGIFSKYRKAFEKEQDGNLLEHSTTELCNTIAFRFDSTGGIYKFLDNYKKGEETYEEFQRICNGIEKVTDTAHVNPTDDSIIVGNPKVHI